jgi:hypothetical protein
MTFFAIPLCQMGRVRYLSAIALQDAQMFIDSLETEGNAEYILQPNLHTFAEA